MDNKNDERIKIKKLNEVLSSSSNILKIVYIVTIVLAIYIITLIFKEWKIFDFIFNILKALSPFFFGLLIAWFLDPIVSFLQKKGMKRMLGAVVTYMFSLALLFLLLSYILPMITNQINELATSLPVLGSDIGQWVTNTINNVASGKFVVDLVDVNNRIDLIFKELTGFLTLNFQTITINIFKSVLSILGIFLVGLIIGFYLLVDYKSAARNIVKIFPKKARGDVLEICKAINNQLRKWVLGTFIISFCIFLTTSIALALVGVKAPLIFGLFCGVTNVIPYAGPFIGGAPAIIVAFTESMNTGIFALVAIIIIQSIESAIFNPLIMGKTMRLHPVTIIVGLLIFGLMFGIVGMLFSTPIIATGKILLEYFDKKYDILNWQSSDNSKRRISITRKK